MQALGPRAQQDQDRGLFGASEQTLEQTNRVLICPLHVVEEQDDLSVHGESIKGLTNGRKGVIAHGLRNFLEIVFPRTGNGWHPV